MAAPQIQQRTSFGVAITRVVWIMVGPLTLAVLAFNIASKGGGLLSATNVAYLAVLAVVLAARWIEFQSGKGQTGSGEMQTATGLQHSLVVTICFGLAVWAAANLVGNYWIVR